MPALATACQRGNIDPQHTGGDASRCAIEEAVTAPLPPAGTVLVTVRPDADALGAMTVLSLRAEGQEIEGDLADRVAQIAQADKEATGPWPGPRPIGAPEDLITPVSAVSAVCMDHRLSMEYRLSIIRSWLLDGEFDGQEEVTARLLQEAQDALGSLDVRVVNGIAVVTGSHRLAMTIGYRFAPVVVATNPRFSWRGGEPHVKHTIARWNSSQPMGWEEMVDALNDTDPVSRVTSAMLRDHRAEIKEWALAAIRQAAQEVLDAAEEREELEAQAEAGAFGLDLVPSQDKDVPEGLAERLVEQMPAMNRPTWGGSSSIVGSPQGRGSKLTTEQVVEIVLKHI